MRERLGRGHHSCADPHTIRTLRERLGDIRTGGNAARSQNHQRLDRANDAPHQRRRSDDALVVPASLPPLRNDGIDVHVRGFHGLFDGGRLLPNAASRRMQSIHPRPGWNIHVKHDQLHAL